MDISLSTNTIMDVNVSDGKCCTRRFIQLSCNGAIETCLSCGYKTKMVTEYECPKCHHIMSCIAHLGQFHTVCFSGCNSKFKNEELITNYRKVICEKAKI